MGLMDADVLLIWIGKRPPRQCSTSLSKTFQSARYPIKKIQPTFFQIEFQGFATLFFFNRLVC